MPRGRRSSRFAIVLLILPLLLLCRCGSEDGGEVIVCYPEQLAAGTYAFNLAGVGSCLKPAESYIRGFFTNVPMVLPGYADLPDHNDVQLTLLEVEVTAKVSLVQGNLVLTDINPQQIDYQGASVTINGVSLCPVSATRVDADLNISVQYQPLGIYCPNEPARVTGSR